ncbi:hypothetical protein CVT25_008914 [Psilocybe cyanescens]|uniref:RNB domain-containing protein n=1 Tax=Psilocybe cyanescens TaxID=93625 RepID=A0A409XN73_PSICY|nr:hypothetical protein CVT25_008914 [Psilocybe cyanescens]
MHQHCLRSSLSYCADTARRSVLGGVRRNISKAAVSRPKEGSSKKASDGRTNPQRPRAQVERKKAAPVQQPTKDALYEAKKLLEPALDETGDLAQQIAVEEDEDAAETTFLPGTFVEIRKNEVAVQGIVLAETIQDHRYHVWTLTTKGLVIDHFRADVYFTIPNLISASLAERCGYGVPTPENNIARVEALKKLRALVSKVDRHAAGMQQRPTNVYVEVMASDPKKWTTTTVAYVTNLLYERPAFMDYYMTHKMLMDQPLYYIANPGYLKNQGFSVRPRREIEEIEEVTKNIHRHRSGVPSPYQKFIAKAQRVVKQYNERRDTGAISQERIAVKWDDEDRLFINFLLRSLQPHQSNQLDPYTLGRTELVRAILKPTKPVNDNLTHELLIRLGIIAPWQDLHEFIPSLNPWGDFSNKNTIETEAADILKASYASKGRAGSVLGPMDFLPSDPLESVRHDFGNARVFVIDDLSAKELDDGVSVERIPSEPENHWVHVHVADPASLIHPNHALARLARERGTSYYLAQKTIPLFPAELVHNPKYSLSLQSKNGELSRVMSFSMKLDGYGNILDYKVRAGLIRNIRKISYDEVDLALGNGLMKKWFPFGGTDKFVSEPSLNDRDLADLRILQNLAHVQVAKRVEKNVVNFDQEFSGVEWNTIIPPDIISPSLGSSIYHGFPDMTYHVYKSADMDSGSRGMVSEMMKLANRTASRVLLEHNVPAIRRCMDPPIFSSPEVEQEIMDMRSTNGYAPIQDIVKRLELNPVGTFSLDPKQHWALGVGKGEGYVRATSPLRRFEDIVCHWQLHHILLGSKSRLPFSAAEMESVLADVDISSKAQAKVNKSNGLFYSLMHIKRFADDIERGVQNTDTNPLASMRAWTKHLPRLYSNTSEMSIAVHLPELGITAQVEDFPFNMKNVPVGTELRVKYKSVDLGIKRTKLFVTLEES